MPDREKVIKRLEECLSASCRGFRTCPYSDTEGWDAVEAALALLREQEPVKPADHGAWGGKKCGECGTIFDFCVREDTTVRMGTGYGYVHNRVRYCPWCGRKVKWDD